MFILLSHSLSIETPAFAGGSGLSISPIKEIETGGSSNSYTLILPNHLGTHIDAPKHFDAKGRPISSYDIEDLMFRRPILIDLAKEESELIWRRDLERFEPSIAKADFLLIRTGFQKYRSIDVKKFCSRNPGISGEGARYLIRFPQLKAIGLDMISASAVEHREEGREAHRTLLTGRDFFIIEDMNLKSYRKGIKRILVAPLMILGVDSAPCTVIGKV